MKTELKCPFCDFEIEQVNDRQRSLLHCSNIVCCKGGHYIGNTSMWRDLIRTRKALDVAIQYIKHTQRVEPFWFNGLANEILDEIKTTLEQKE